MKSLGPIEWVVVVVVVVVAVIGNGVMMMILLLSLLLSKGLSDFAKSLGPSGLVTHRPMQA